MEKNELIRYLENYGITSVTTFEVIDSTNGNDLRWNVIIDKKYVLRINNNVMTEERVASIDRLCERYRTIGIQTPRLYKNKYGNYITQLDERICYLSDYIDISSENECECDHNQVRKEVLKSIGTLSKRYSDYDLSPINSMWSIIDLAPLDIDIDEKQENLNLLVKSLNDMQENELANRVNAFNEAVRERIKAVYKLLPRCVIQGDLNSSNILVKDNHFVGLIDFNMAGTEVNVNNFCAETNEGILEEDFEQQSAEELYENWISLQNEELGIILQEYELNEMESKIIREYRSICLISQYPNVMAYLEFLKRDKDKMIEILNHILSR